MSKRKWHDLIADPSDLPPVELWLHKLLVTQESQGERWVDEAYFAGSSGSDYGGGFKRPHYCASCDTRPTQNVIAWREMPKAYRPPASETRED